VSLDPGRKPRVSIVVEWANTVYNGVPRAQALLDILGRQWDAMVARDYPPHLPAEAKRYLESLDSRAEILVVSGSVVSVDEEKEIRRRVPDCFDVSVHVGKALEYYALKNFGAELASGDILLFLDSDVHPDPGWLAHLLGSFARAEIHAVSGQPYVAPTDVFAAAFALGWTYELPDESGRLLPCKKFYGNNLAFRTETFRRTGFPRLDRRTRGASSLLGRRLEALGHSVWLNCHSRVDHPPPASLKHMIVRALAHGRDIYMVPSEERTLRGFLLSQRTAARRFVRGLRNTARSWRRVGLRPWQLPAVVGIIGTYYAFFALGGALTHVSPAVMGRRFRI
jgi:glycosyltransferase involved in cell wall biosynthesis